MQIRRYEAKIPISAGAESSCRGFENREVSRFVTRLLLRTDGASEKTRIYASHARSFHVNAPRLHVVTIIVTNVTA